MYVVLDLQEKFGQNIMKWYIFMLLISHILLDLHRWNIKDTSTIQHTEQKYKLNYRQAAGVCDDSKWSKDTIS